MGDSLKTTWLVTFSNQGTTPEVAYVDLDIVEGGSFNVEATSSTSVTVMPNSNVTLSVSCSVGSASGGFYDYYDEIYVGYISGGKVQLDTDLAAYWSLN